MLSIRFHGAYEVSTVARTFPRDSRTCAERWSPRLVEVGTPADRTWRAQRLSVAAVGVPSLLVIGGAVGLTVFGILIANGSARVQIAVTVLLPIVSIFNLFFGLRWGLDTVNSVRLEVDGSWSCATVLREVNLPRGSICSVRVERAPILDVNLILPFVFICPAVRLRVTRDLFRDPTFLRALREHSGNANLPPSVVKRALAIERGGFGRLRGQATDETTPWEP